MDPSRRGIFNLASSLLRYPHRPTAVELQNPKARAVEREERLRAGPGWTVLPADGNGAGHVRGAGAVFQTTVSCAPGAIGAADAGEAAFNG